MKDNEFDDILKKKLFDFQVDQPYNEHTWDDKFAAAIQSQKPKKRPFWKFLKNSIWTFIFGLLVHSSEQIVQDVVLDGNEVQANSFSGIGQDFNQTIDSENQQKTQKQSQRPTTIHQEQNKTQSFKQESQKPTQLSKRPEVSHTKKVYANKIKNTDMQEAANLKGLTKTENNDKTEITFIKPPEKQALPNVKRLSLFVKPIDYQGFKYIKYAYKDTVQEMRTVEIQYPVRAKRRLSFSVGLEYAYLTPFLDGVDEVQRTDKIGLLGELSWGRFSILSGISRQRSAYKFKENSVAPQASADLGFLTPKATSFASRNVSYERLQIPITLRYYQPIYKNWGLVGGIGLSFEKNNQEMISYDASEYLGGGIVNYTVDIENSENKFHLRKFQSSLHLSYMLRPKLKIQAGVAYFGNLGNVENTQINSNALEYQFRVFYKLWQK